MAKRLFIPGPVDVSEDVAAKMAEPMVGHRSREYAELHGSCVKGLKKILMTDNNVFIGPMSASGWMEAAVRNCVSKKALHVVNGAFSSRWYKISKANGKPAEAVEVKWGSAGKPEDVGDKLGSGEYDALFVTHNETSTGAMTPLEGFGKICADNDVIFCVDAVSSASGVKIETDKLGIDVLVTGTQKCFAVAPGLAMTAVSERALKRSEAVDNRGLYFDYQDFLKKAEKDNTPSTPPIPQIRALDYQCQKIIKEGLEARFKRHADMAEHVQSWVRDNWELFCEDWCLSTTVTCARNTRGYDLAELGKRLGERGYQFSNGYGKLKGEAFRIAHMGDRQMPELKEYLEDIEDIVGI
ncbi:MAG: aminotransferase class V-fold PLP-dependent enzyme [Candidatus Altiarchaeales archaeon]|nr:aminotransferase class V-fold PLP-dependent enzyme [Candidatus Altiarchaeales archaeon]MBD3415863.1 aminotransferase class V-fold PLP-dependent enzyme [Candidatus Altiarchaeales archaeon]